MPGSIDDQLAASLGRPLGGHPLGTNGVRYVVRLTFDATDVTAKRRTGSCASHGTRRSALDTQTSSDWPAAGCQRNGFDWLGSMLMNARKRQFPNGPRLPGRPTRCRQALLAPDARRQRDCALVAARGPVQGMRPAELARRCNRTRPTRNPASLSHAIARRVDQAFSPADASAARPAAGTRTLAIRAATCTRWLGPRNRLVVGPRRPRAMRLPAPFTTSADPTHRRLGQTPRRRFPLG